ncbi:MAG: response regulator [Oscillospiraceae bacterium]|nr:response regulator [Oscillospiraceae bacterium]
MKKQIGKAWLPFSIITVSIAVIFAGITYFNFMSRRIYEDSAVQLKEIYAQVNRSFGAFVNMNWKMLESKEDFFEVTDITDNRILRDFMDNERKYWGFSEFYFISKDKTCITPAGEEGNMTFENSWDDLMEKRPVISSEIMSGQSVTVFAVPVESGEYNGFEYDAVAVSYTNEDMAASLDVDAFSGEAKCFVISDDGNILMSTQTGGNVFENYLTYLKAASDLNENDIAGIINDWRNGNSNLLRCEMGDTDYCILYQPVGYRDYILLSIVPQSVMSAGFLSVQKITMNVFAVMFIFVGTFVFSVIFIRHRKQSHKNKTELRYRERMFDVLSNSVDDIFIMLNSEDYNVDYISPNIERLLGIPVKTAIENIGVIEKCAVDSDVVISKEELEEIPLNENIYREGEYRHRNTGDCRWYKMTIYHMSILDVDKYIVVMSDRTMENQMNHKTEEALRAARSANEAKSNFLSNMSHDIRTPMNAIVGFSILLEKDADDPEKVRKYTHKITASSKHLLNLINDVLDMSKIESGKTSLNVDRFSLHELLEELKIIVSPQIKTKNQIFNVYTSDATADYIIGDKLRLNQILINLLSNATKYTPDGGEIEFIVREIPQSAPQYVKLQFVVKDNGIGMSEEFQQIIFSPFSREINSVTNTIQGTGLGMAITKNLVDLMGGIIVLQSRPGEGSTFIVELTFALAEREADKNDISPETTVDEGIMKGRNFLVAEDNELNAEILTELLAIEGAKCELAVNGEVAVEMFENSQPDYYDMIFMDLQMPVMNGYEAAGKIRKCGHPKAKTIPIAAMTANTFAEDVHNALAAGMDGHLAKPVNMDDVRKLVGKLLSDNNE